MCISYTVRYMCACIYDEWYFPCWISNTESSHPSPNIIQSQALASNSKAPATRCQMRTIHETHDILTLCEECIGVLHARVRRDGMRKVLDNAMSFPLARYLGMLIVYIQDEDEYWRVFGKRLGERAMERARRRVLLREREWYVPVTEGVVAGKRGRVVRARERKGRESWKYKWKFQRGEAQEAKEEGEKRGEAQEAKEEGEKWVESLIMNMV